MKKEFLKVVPFKRRLFSFLEMNDRSDLIDVFDEKLKPFPKRMEKDIFREEFQKLLIKNFHCTEVQSKKMFSQIYFWVGKKRSSSLGKDKFKYVSNKKPLQGGSPGLGKKK